MILTTILDNSLFLIILWIVIFVLTLIIELSTDQLVSIWFSAGSIIALILAICDVKWYIQFLIFVLVSCLSLALAQYFIIKKRKNSQNSKTNIDSLIGMTILVTKKITADSLGEGKIRDIVWSLKSDQEIDEGEEVEIIDISGNKLIVKKKEDNKNVK